MEKKTLLLIAVLCIGSFLSMDTHAWRGYYRYGRPVRYGYGPGYYGPSRGLLAADTALTGTALIAGAAAGAGAARSERRLRREERREESTLARENDALRRENDALRKQITQLEKENDSLRRKLAKHDKKYTRKHSRPLPPEEMVEEVEEA